MNRKELIQYVKSKGIKNADKMNLSNLCESLDGYEINNLAKKTCNRIPRIKKLPVKTFEIGNYDKIFYNKNIFVQYVETLGLHDFLRDFASLNPSFIKIENYYDGDVFEESLIYFKSMGNIFALSVRLPIRGRTIELVTYLYNAKYLKLHMQLLKNYRVESLYPKDKVPKSLDYDIEGDYFTTSFFNIRILQKNEKLTKKEVDEIYVFDTSKLVNVDNLPVRKSVISGDDITFDLTDPNEVMINTINNLNQHQLNNFAKYYSIPEQKDKSGNKLTYTAKYLHDWMENVWRKKNKGKKNVKVEIKEEQEDENEYEEEENEENEEEDEDEEEEDENEDEEEEDENEDEEEEEEEEDEEEEDEEEEDEEEEDEEEEDEEEEDDEDEQDEEEEEEDEEKEEEINYNKMRKDELLKYSINKLKNMKVDELRRFLNN